MNIDHVDLVIVRGLIPICLAGCTVVRYNGFSFIYLLLLLVCPLLRRIRGNSTRPIASAIPGPTEVFLAVLISISGLFCLAHAFVNISIISHPHFLLNGSSSLTVVAGHIGVVNFKNVIPSRIVRLVLPDFLILFISIVLLIYFQGRKGTLCHTSKEKSREKDKNNNNDIPQNRIKNEEECNIENETVIINQQENLNTKNGNEEYIEMKQINKQTSYMRTTLGIDQRQNLNYWIKKRLFVFFNVIIIGFAGIILPSVLHFTYFFLFLGICTFWACDKNVVTKHFFHTSLFILIYSALHICAFYLTQIEYFQQFIPDGHFLSRFLGLYCLFDTTFKEKGKLTLKSQSWVRYASPVIILYVYYICATFTRQWIEKKHIESKKTVIIRVSRGQTETIQAMTDTNLEESVPLQINDIFEEPDNQSVESNGPRIDFSGIYNSKLSLAVTDGIAALFSHEKERPFLISVLNSIIRNSFVFTFIAMMAWSVTYQSWMSFVFLLLACYLWMKPNSRNACLYASPIIVLYATILIIIQYIYGLHIFELPFIMNITNKSPIELSEIGLHKWENSLGPLSVMIGYLTMFWLTLRLFMTEKYCKKKKHRLENKNDVDSKESSYNYLENNMGNTDNFVYKAIMKFLQKVCEKYWILVCCFAMLYISIQAPVVLFRIFYMVLLLYFLLVFMFSYPFWRSQMKIFWWIVIIYSMIVLLNIYLFQFKNVSYMWLNISGLSENNLRDIGLQRYDESSHIQDLLTPVIFLVIIIVQLRYFHDSFLKLSSINNPCNLDPDHNKYNRQCTKTFMSVKHLDSPQPFELMCENIRKLLNSVEPKIWLILELHFTKVVAIVIVYICILEINACNIVLIVFVVIGFPYPRFHTYFVSSSFLYCSLIVLIKIVYQLNIVPEFQWTKNCSKSGSTEKFDNIKWIGLKKVEDFPKHILKWTSVLVSCMVWHMIRYHQKQFYNHSGSKKPDRGIIFPEINIHSSTDSFRDLLKFCMNFTTYKFGHEISLLTTVIVSCLRVDVYSLIYLIILFLFLLLKKKFAYRIWEHYLKVLSVLLFLQYAVCVGLPPGLCIEYPFEVDIKLRRWLYLPYHKSPPVPKKIMVDLIQFIFVALQYQAYQTANSKDSTSVNYGTDVVDNGEPVKLTEKDFITFKNSYIDYVKHAIFYWSYWLSLAVIFTTGVFWINIFGLGYLILAFFYLWSGQNIILQKKKRLIIAWNCILVYNFLVILLKCTFQLLGCVYIQLLTDKGLCWMISLCGIQCINPMSWEIVNVHSKSVGPKCETVASGLHWDVVCFFFIIFQKKIFQSKSFLHVILDLNVQNMFLSRGALLINKKIMERINEQIDKEKKELEIIQKKINKINKQQTSHGKPELNDHYLVIRSGDYYLFNKDSEDENYENSETEEMYSSKGSFDYFDFMDEQTTSTSDKNNMNINASLHDTMRNNSQNSAISNNLEKKICTTSKSGLSDEVDDSDNDMQSDVLLNPLDLLDKVIREGPTAAVREFKRTLSESKDMYSNSRRSSLLVQSRFDMAPILSHNNDPDLVDNAMSTNISVSSKEELSRLSIGHSSLLSPRPHSFYIDSTIPSEDEPNESSSSNVIETDFTFETSHDLEKSDQQKMKNCCTTLKTSLIFLGCFIQSSVIQLNIYLNAWVQDYNSIRKILNKEKWLTKCAVLLRNIDEIDGRMNIEEDITNQSRRSEIPENKEERKKTQTFRRSRSSFFTLIILLSNVAFIYSEFCCYLLLIVNHMLSGNLLSLLYPLFVFLWAMLSVPRPSKALWIVLITYTEIVIVIKYIFQFKYFTFNIPQNNPTENNPLWLPSIIGIEQSNNYALLDEIQLLFIFLHRGYLKSNGLWGDHSEFYRSIQSTNGDEPPVQGNCSCTLIQKMYQFYFKMTNPKLNRKIDVYSLMFLCEFLALLIMILGYVSFGPGTDSGGHAIDFIKADKIPVPFIIMIITQFLFFVIDRALFLRKNVTGKFVFQIFHVFLIHAWLFFALPYITKKKFNKQLAPQILYFVKCVYFALSAYQMKSGYPWRIIGNFLTWKFNYVNLVFFKIYMYIPFLYELRNIMDWMWTDTTVAFYHWMEVEDIFSKIFVLKCWRFGELYWITERGKNRRLVVKYIVGGGLLLFLSICIWGPLTISSFIGNTFDKNPPVECSFSIDIGGYSPLFVFISRENNMKSVSKETFDIMKKCYENHTISMDFMKSFAVEDITQVRIDGASDDVWLITPPGFRKLKEKLNSKNESLKINMQAVCERQTKDSKSMDRIIRFTYSRLLSVEEKDNLLGTLNTNGSLNVYLPSMFPRFLTAYKRKFSEANALLNYRNYSNLNLSLTMKVENTTKWWEVSQKILDTEKCFEPNISADYSYLTVYIFSERISDHFFGNIFSNYGILGIYAAYFFLVNRILRSFYGNISYIVQFEELPDVDRIYKLIREIYLVRENKMFRLEEQLIAKLIFLYRSSETMIKWTKHSKSVINNHKETKQLPV